MYCISQETAGIATGTSDSQAVYFHLVTDVWKPFGQCRAGVIMWTLWEQKTSEECFSVCAKQSEV